MGLQPSNWSQIVAVDGFDAWAVRFQKMWWSIRWWWWKTEKFTHNATQKESLRKSRKTESRIKEVVICPVKSENNANITYKILAVLKRNKRNQKSRFAMPKPYCQNGTGAEPRGYFFYSLHFVFTWFRKGSRHFDVSRVKPKKR